MINGVWHPVGETNECLIINARGNGYEEISCSFGYPVFEYVSRLFLLEYKFQVLVAGILSHSAFVCRFERTFTPKVAYEWMEVNPMFPVYAVLLYAFLIRFGQRYFENRKPWNLRGALAAWNLTLSVFSAVGFLRTAPALFRLLSKYSMQENFCYDPEHNYGCGSAGLWTLLFIWSKFPELFDTFFIVVHKKPLIFLHWYHHISVLLYCWHSYVNKAPHGIVFVVMNYAVHSVMYGYYFLMAIRCKPKAFSAIYITLAQISQMVVGVAVTMIGCYYLWFDKTFNKQACKLSPDNNVAALIMYGSYLCLFLEFFFKRYFGKAKAPGPKREKTE